VRYLRGHKKAVYCLAFLPEGRLASAGLEGEVCVWTIATGERQVIAREAGRIEWLSASPDGVWLAWCGAGPWVGVVHTQGKVRAERLATQKDQPYPQRVEACAFAPDGRSLLAVGDGPRCWRTGNWKPIRWAEAWWGQRAASCLAFAPDSGTVATGAYLPGHGGSGWSVCFWDTRTGVSRPAFPAGHPFDGDLTFTNLAYSPDGRLLAGLCPNELRVWVAETGKVLHLSCCDAGPLHGVAFSPDGRRLATGGIDGVVTIRDTATWVESARHDGKLANVQDVAFSADGRLLAACGSRGKVVVWDVES
jgi:WD40 repeat protein